MEHYINPYTDFGFKKIFGTEGNKELLRDFLNTLLPAKHQIATLTFANTERLGNNKAEKAITFDIRCKNEKGESFIIEIQRASQTYFIKRALYYVCDLIRSQNPRPEGVPERDVYNLTPVYFIGILDFVYDQESFRARDTVLVIDSKFEKSELVRTADFRDQNNELLTDLVHMSFVQMPLFDKTPEQLVTQRDKWFYFLKHLPSLDHIPAILNEPVFQQAFKTASYVALTPDEQAIYNDHEKAWLDNYSAKITAVNAAIRKTTAAVTATVTAAVTATVTAAVTATVTAAVTATVARETKRKVALGMKQEGLPDEIIARITGFTIAEIEAL
jgi:predicted transposase/invertase (TIGR01784 family)